MSSTGNKPIDSINKPISFDVIINGVSIKSKYTIIKINVDKAINKISKARVYISGGNANLNTFEESENTNFTPGKQVVLKFGYDQINDIVFEGVIEKLGISLKNGFITQPWSSLLVLSCVDKAIKLTNSYTSDVYEDKKESEIFSSLINNVSGLSATISPTSVTHPFFPKYNSSDWDFIIDRAKINGLVVLNSDNKIKISEPKKEVSQPEQTITNGESTLNFDAQIDSSSQLSALQLDSWNSFTNASNQSQAVEPSLIANNILTGSEISAATSAASININIPQTTEVSELKVIADGILQSSRLNRIVGRATFKGVTNIDIGSVVALYGFGRNFDGNIYITAISHQIESGIFTTIIEFGLKNNIFNSNVIDKSKIISPINGIHIGTVKKIDADPLNENRIQVLIPALKATGNGIWAKLSHFYTSTEAGSFFVPEVGSQVVISFIADDPRQPIVLGGLYTNTNNPYTTVDSDNSLNAFVSKSKLTLEFNDKDKIITLKTPENNSIVISEKTKDITITDQNDNLLKMSENGITLSSKKDIKIDSSEKISMIGAKGVSIEGKSGKGVEVSGNKVLINGKTSLIAKGGKADFTSSGKVTIKGGTVGIN
jgi:phage protein D/phage baseplate assembly protein gpV